MNERRLPPAIECRHRLKVRYGETDQMGIVYHTNYLVWFHEARDALLSALGMDIVSLEQEGYRFPLVDVGCRYLHPARYGDEIDIRVRLLPELVARMQFDFEARNRRTARLLSTGSCLSVMTDRSGRLLLRLPETILTCLRRAAGNLPVDAAGSPP